MFPCFQDSELSLTVPRPTAEGRGTASPAPEITRRRRRFTAQPGVPRDSHPRASSLARPATRRTRSGRRSPSPTLNTQRPQPYEVTAHRKVPQGVPVRHHAPPRRFGPLSTAGAGAPCVALCTATDGCPWCAARISSWWVRVPSAGSGRYAAAAASRTQAGDPDDDRRIMAPTSSSRPGERAPHVGRLNVPLSGRRTCKCLGQPLLFGPSGFSSGT
jgi:hypothetical protein